MMLRNKRLNYDSRFTSYWWLEGGIPSTAPVAVYQAKGAQGYNDSLINLVYPGQNTLYQKSWGRPSFDTNTGWYFALPYDQLLQTGQINLTNPSVIIRYSDIQANTNVNRGWLFGFYGFSRFAIRASINNVRSYHYQNTSFDVAGNLTTGVVALTKDASYVDGAKDGDIAKAFSNYNFSWGIGGEASNVSGTSCKIQAVAIYNNYTLSLAEVVALTAAMNAL